MLARPMDTVCEVVPVQSLSIRQGKSRNLPPQFSRDMAEKIAVSLKGQSVRSSLAHRFIELVVEHCSLRAGDCHDQSYSAECSNSKHREVSL